LPKAIVTISVTFYSVEVLIWNDVSF
jgi:hypothetical protein